jgi:hypothetical protein
MGRWLPVVALVVFAAACAEVARPPGGPVDDVPPVLATVSPGSLATFVDPEAPLEFAFSERIDRRRFTRSLLIVPDRPVENISFDGPMVRVSPVGGWPADTTVVWVLLPSLPDKHGVAMGAERSGAFTTGASLPPGRIIGQTYLDSLARVGADGPEWSTLRVRLTLDPLEGSRQRRPWRFADGGTDGSFELPWIELPSGPFQLEAWLDKNGDARRDAREPVATVDSLFVGVADSILQIDPGLLRLVDLEGPVPVGFCLDSVATDSVPVVVWTWPWEANQPAKTPVDSTGCLTVDLVPGDVRWGAWLDLDGDLAWSRLEDGTSEPFVVGDTLLVEPASPQQLVLTWPESAIAWSAIDTMRVPPVPREAWSPSSF